LKPARAVTGSIFERRIDMATSTVVGLFDELSDAQSAAKDLVDSGFRRDDVSIVANNARGEYVSDAGQGDLEDTEDVVEKQTVGAGFATGRGPLR